jgi:hypothetical protein
MLLGTKNSKTNEPNNADVIATPIASQRIDPIEEQIKHSI